MPTESSLSVPWRFLVLGVALAILQISSRRRDHVILETQTPTDASRSYDRVQAPQCRSFRAMRAFCPRPMRDHRRVDVQMLRPHCRRECLSQSDQETS